MCHKGLRISINNELLKDNVVYIVRERDGGLNVFLGTVWNIKSVRRCH